MSSTTGSTTLYSSTVQRRPPSIDGQRGAFSLPQAFASLSKSLLLKHRALFVGPDSDFVENMLDLYLYSRMVQETSYAGRITSNALEKVQIGLKEAAAEVDDELQHEILTRCHNQLDAGLSYAADDVEKWKLVRQQRKSRQSSLKLQDTIRELRQIRHHKDDLVSLITRFQLQPASITWMKRGRDTMPIIVHVSSNEAELRPSQIQWEGNVGVDDMTGAILRAFFGKRAEDDPWAQIYHIRMDEFSETTPSPQCSFLLKKHRFKEYQSWVRREDKLEIHLVWRQYRYQMVTIAHPDDGKVLIVGCHRDLQEYLTEALKSLPTNKKKKKKKLSYLFMETHFSRLEDIESDTTRKMALAKYWEMGRSTYPHPQPVTVVLKN